MLIIFITLPSSKISLDWLLCIKAVHQLKKLSLSNMYDIHEKPSGFCIIKAGCLFAA